MESIDRSAYERWRAKKLHYQDPAVVESYDALRFATRSQRAATARKWRVIERVLVRDLPRGARVLDIPSGTGRFTRALLGAGARVVDADISRPMIASSVALEQDARGLQGGVQCEAERLPFADASFDLVLSIRFLFHVPRALRPAILREFARVSRRFVLIDVRHKYCFSTHTKRWRAWILHTRAPSKRYSLREIDEDVEAARLKLVERAWIAPLFSEKMLLVLEKR